ncbi:MAG: c-type cytochrome [Candidatus Sulfotelmatobacter sp.]
MKSRISHLVHSIQIFLGSIAALMILWIPAAQSLLAQDQHFHDAPTSSSEVKNPYADQASAVAAGAKLYAANCGSCHGIAGRGTGNIPALNSGATQSAPDGEVFWFITTGSTKNGMPSWNGLAERKRWQLVTYLKSLTKSARARPNQAANVRGET